MFWSLLWTPAWSGDPTGAVHVVVTGLRDDEGLVHVALYDHPEGFPADGRHAFRSASLPISEGRVEVTFDDVPYGVYAVGFLHDENGDRVMGKNALGVPREGYGASNDPPRRLGPPRYEDAEFPVDRPTVDQVLHPIYWL